VATPAPAVKETKPAPKMPGKVITLFNGKDFEGWTTIDSNPAKSWTVGAGYLVNHAAGNDLFTKSFFHDVEVSLEYLLPAYGNSGVFLRGRYEIQLLDSKAEADARKKQGGKLNLATLNGAIYGQIAPSKNSYRGAGKWNSLTASIIGSRVK